MAFFPFGTAIFAPFRPKSQVFPATFLILFGELPATKRRQVRRPFVTKFAVSSPFAAWGFSFRLYARRGWAPPLRRFAARKSTSPKLRRFAARKSPTTPTSSLCRVKVRPNHSAFALRPGEVRRFAVLKSTKRPGFSLHHGKLSQFALAKSQGGVRSPGSPWRRPRPRSA